MYIGLHIVKSDHNELEEDIPFPLEGFLHMAITSYIPVIMLSVFHIFVWNLPFPKISTILFLVFEYVVKKLARIKYEVKQRSRYGVLLSGF